MRDTARNVANQLVAGFAVIDGEPVIYHSATYEGGPVESLYERLNPYDVLLCSRVDTLPEGRKIPDTVAVVAQKILTLDIQEQIREKVERGEAPGYVFKDGPALHIGDTFLVNSELNMGEIPGGTKITVEKFTRQPTGHTTYFSCEFPDDSEPIEEVTEGPVPLLTSYLEDAFNDYLKPC